jgi:hypothetical protein
MIQPFKITSIPINVIARGKSSTLVPEKIILSWQQNLNQNVLEEVVQ